MLFKLLGLPVTLPAAGIKFCLQQVVNAAEAELTDEAPVHEALMLLNLQLEEGEIGEDEFAAREAALFRRLREIKAYKKERLQAAAAAPAATVSTRGAPAVVEYAPEADRRA